MRRGIRLLIVANGLSYLIQAPNSAAEFSRDIAPILVTECLACHSADKAKGGYRVDTFSALLQPGKRKESPVVSGMPENSALYKRLVTHDEEDRMPQDDDPLPEKQIA